MAKRRRRFRKSKRRAFRQSTPRHSSVRLRTPEQIVRDATKPIHIIMPGYRYVPGRGYISAAEDFIYRALNPSPLPKLPGTPLRFRKQKPGW